MIELHRVKTIEYQEDEGNKFYAVDGTGPWTVERRSLPHEQLVEELEERVKHFKPGQKVGVLFPELKRESKHPKLPFVEWRIDGLYLELGRYKEGQAASHYNLSMQYILGGHNKYASKFELYGDTLGYWRNKIGYLGEITLGLSFKSLGQVFDVVEFTASNRAGSGGDARLLFKKGKITHYTKTDVRGWNGHHTINVREKGVQTIYSSNPLAIFQDKNLDVPSIITELYPSLKEPLESFKREFKSVFGEIEPCEFMPHLIGGP